jgi:hypothetical protein
VTRLGRASSDAAASSNGSPRSLQCSPPIAAIPLTPVHGYRASLHSLPVLPAKELRRSPGSAIFSPYNANALTPEVMARAHRSGWTEGMLEARAKLIAENIHRAAQGKPPVHLIPAPAA